MQSQVFREKSVERVSSPEQLQDYMRVAGPGIWMVLAAVIAVLAGLIISSAMATLESSIPAQAVVEADGGSLQIALPLAQKDLVKPGMVVRVADREAGVSLIYQREGAVQVIAELKDPGAALAAGIYDAQIVTETIKPISFLLNGGGSDE